MIEVLLVLVKLELDDLRFNKSIGALYNFVLNNEALLPLLVRVLHNETELVDGLELSVAVLFALKLLCLLNFPLLFAELELNIGLPLCILLLSEVKDLSSGNIWLAVIRRTRLNISLTDGRRSNLGKWGKTEVLELLQSKLLSNGDKLDCELCLQLFEVCSGERGSVNEVRVGDPGADLLCDIDELDSTTNVGLVGIGICKDNLRGLLGVWWVGGLIWRWNNGMEETLILDEGESNGVLDIIPATIEAGLEIENELLFVWGDFNTGLDSIGGESESCSLTTLIFNIGAVALNCWIDWIIVGLGGFEVLDGEVGIGDLLIKLERGEIEIDLTLPTSSIKEGLIHKDKEEAAAPAVGEEEEWILWSTIECVLELVWLGDLFGV